MFARRRAEFDQDEPTWSTFSSKVRFAARAEAKFHCRRSIELDGLVLRRQDRFALPLEDCDMPWCPCRWDWVTNE